MRSPTDDVPYKPGASTIRNDNTKAHMREIEIYRGQGYKNNVYPDNSISTNKYNYLTLFQKNLFEQFQRIGNIWYLIITFLQYIPYNLSPIVSTSTTATFVIVLMFTLFHDAFADYLKRRSDSHINSRDVLVWSEERQEFFRERWKEVRVGHIIVIKNDEEVPADMILLATSDPEDICFLETSNLDGETRLTIKKAVPDTAAIFESKNYERAIEELYRLDNASIKIDHPNSSLYSLDGNLKLINYPRALPLHLENFVYRGSQIKNTAWCLGIVVYTGFDTKIIRNTQRYPGKRSQLEKQMNKYLACMFLILIFMVAILSIISIASSHEHPHRYSYFTQNRPSSSAYDIISFLILFSYMMPITLYVIINIVSFAQSFLIISDLRFYDENRTRNIEANDLHLNEELGKVQYIFTDKTGTLTDNEMKFKYCVIKSKNYDEAQLAERFTYDTSKRTFEFLEVLALCHTVIPFKTNKGIQYKGVSKDEETIVKAAKAAGVEYRNVKHNICELKINGNKRLYKIYGINEFDPVRKRMSIVVKSLDDNSLPVLLCKGADISLFGRANNSSKYITRLSKAIDTHAKAGLRTLVVGRRILTLDEAERYEELWLSAKNAMSSRRQRLISVAEEFEVDLEIVGSIAIEDKIQKGAPEAIQTLRKAGIKIWMLTGDKRETAMNAAYACKLLDSNLDVIQISFVHTRQVLNAVRQEYFKRVFPMEEYDDPDHDLNNIEIETHEMWDSPRKGQQVDTQNSKEYDPAKNNNFGIVIDGSALEVVFQHVEYLKYFLTLSYIAKSVIVCRAAPIQKAKIVKIVKENDITHPVTLAIGDGSNDVSMIHEANVGIGILGNEGFQAANSSDFAIISFRHLVPLLLIHGHWNYTRIAQVIQTIIYNNFLLVFVLFLFSFVSMYSASLLYDSWLITLFHILFTSLPIITMGILDRDMTADQLLEYPEIYNTNQLQFKHILAYVLTAIYQAIIIFLFGIIFISHGALSSDGETEDFFSLGCAAFLMVFQVTMHELFLTEKTWNWIFLVVSAPLFIFTYIFIFIYDYGLTATYYMEGTSTKLYSSPIGLFSLFIGPLVCLSFRLAFYYAYKLFFKQSEAKYMKVKTVTEDHVITSEASTDFTKSFNFKQYNADEYLKPTIYNYQMDPLTLKFDNQFLENEFRADLIHDRYKYWKRMTCLTMICSFFVFIISLALPDRESHRAITGVLGICFIVLLILYILMMTKRSFKKYNQVMIYWLATCLLFKIFIDARFANEFSLITNLVSFGSFGVLCIYTHITFLLNIVYLIIYSIWVFVISIQQNDLANGLCVGFIYFFLSLGIICLSAIIGHTLERGKKLQYLYLELVEFQYNKGLEILANLFPHFIKNKVKNGERAIALEQPHVTVMFCDIYGFDGICASHLPAELIELLDAYFALLDKLCEDFGVAKIETVNKTYMACAGIEEDEKLLARSKTIKNHGVRMLEFAVEILEKLKHVYLKNGEKLRVKIGINSGPVIAGVVGLHKPQFSLVGDTVNTASRMTSTLKEPDSIQITSETYELVFEGAYEFTPNQVEAKGKGLLNTFIVKKMQEPHLSRDWSDPFDDVQEIDNGPQENMMRKFGSNKTDDFITTKYNRFYTVYKGREKGELMTEGESVLNDLVKRTGHSRHELGLVNDVHLCKCQYHSKQEEAEFRTKFMKRFKTTIRNAIWGSVSIILLTTIVQLLAYIFTNDHIPIQVIAIKLFILLVLASALIRYKSLYKKALFSWIIIFGFFLLGILNVISLSNSPHLLIPSIVLEILFELQLIGHLCFLPFANLLVASIVLILPVIVLVIYVELVHTPGILIPFLIFNAINIFIAYYKEKQSRTTFNLHKLMKREISRTSTLLNQLIPPHVVRNMMEDLATTDKFDDVTIIFADICGFTAFSSTRTPEQVVSMLSGFFTIFDKLCVEHNVYKVHTIGDCYVIISFRDAESRRNLRNLQNECQNMVNMAFDMVKAIQTVNKENNLDLNMRIGIHTGDLVAGITGTNIVRYDIYGPDVDIANKMESGGAPGKVDISEVTKKHLEEGFPGAYSYEFNKNISHKPVDRTLESYFISKIENKTEVSF